MPAIKYNIGLAAITKIVRKKSKSDANIVVNDADLVEQIVKSETSHKCVLYG